MLIKTVNYLIFLLYLLNFNFGQELLSQKNYADSLFNSGNYFNSVTEYKRLQFFDENNLYRFQSNYKIGLAYKAGAKLEEASKYFALGSLSARTPEDYYESATQFVRVEILRRNTDQAFRMLNELENNNEYAAKKEEITYWRGWAYIFADDWKNAAEEFSRITPDHELAKLCGNVSARKLSVTFAKVISYILPGSGQFYSGEYVSGFMSFAWNVLLGYYTINAALSERVFDALVIGNLAWLRFYRGNIQNSEKFAVEKNIEIANEALYYLQTNYEGIKP